jgi:hypothetical protein
MRTLRFYPPGRVGAACAFSLLAIVPGYAQPPRIQPCDVFPADHVVNQRVDALPVDSRSSDYISRIGAGSLLAANFGSGRVNGAPVGIPFTTVPGSQNRVAMQFEVATESDPGPYPIPPNAAVEGGSSSTGDRRCRRRFPAELEWTAARELGVGGHCRAARAGDPGAL